MCIEASDWSSARDGVPGSVGKVGRGTAAGRGTDRRSSAVSLEVHQEQRHSPPSWWTGEVHPLGMSACAFITQQTHLPTFVLLISVLEDIGVMEG